MEFEQLQRAIEAILFAAGERMEISRLSEVLEVDPDEIEKAADAMAAELAAAADAYTGKNTKEKVYLVGPVDAAIAKVNDIYKKIIYLKAENYDTLVKIKNRTEVYARESRYYKNVTVMFDFNPVNGF